MSGFEIVMASLTAIYVGATIFYAIVSYHTLSAIQKQGRDNANQFAQQIAESVKSANAARDSADAAVKSTALLVASQQPYIAAKPHGNPGQDFCSPEGQHIQLDIYNTGLTPAYDCVTETWLEIFDNAFVDFTTNAEYTKRINKFSLRADEKPVTINIPIRTPLSQDRVRAIKQHKVFVCFRVRVTYRDSFTPERYASFGHQLMGDGLAFLPKYNDSN